MRKNIKVNTIEIIHADFEKETMILYGKVNFKKLYKQYPNCIINVVKEEVQTYVMTLETFVKHATKLEK